MFLSPEQCKKGPPPSELGVGCKKNWPWLSLIISFNNKSSTTCSMELIICAGIFSSLVLLIRGAGPEQWRYCKSPFLTVGCIIQKESRHWLTEMSNGSEFTWVVPFVGGICSLLVSKWIISVSGLVLLKTWIKAGVRERERGWFSMHAFTSEQVKKHYNYNRIILI